MQYVKYCIIRYSFVEYFNTFVFFSLQLFKDKVLELGEKLLPAFNTPTGIPRGVINLGR